MNATVLGDREAINALRQNAATDGLENTLSTD